MTLALLLTAVGGAWAQDPVDGTIAWSVGNEASATVSASIMDAISSTGVTTGSGLTVESGIYFETNMVKYTPKTANAGNVSGVMIEYRIETANGFKFKPTGVDYAAVKVGTDNLSYSWSYTIDGAESAITDVSKDDVLRSNGNNSGTAQLMHSESITADGCSVFTLRFYISNCGTTKNICIGNITISGSVSAAASATGPTVAWNKAEKTGTFTMPGGNVTLEPEYYPQAALTAAPTAINDVPATTDGAIVKAGTVANIGSTETAQGTVMYYVSQTALDDAALLALAADKWTADVPTAEKLTKGQAYVYYYVRGNDSDNDEENFSDGDILSANALTVTIAAEPTYAVTFAEGTDPNEWTADPNADVTKGQTVTVTYTGSKKVIGVKAEKKAAAPAGPITVTWNGADITGSGFGTTFTKDGVTITAGDIEFDEKNFIGGGTFTTTLGNFTKIEVTTDGWYASGTGWSGSTWTGNASSVSFSGEIMGYGGDNLKFVFTIEPTN